MIASPALRRVPNACPIGRVSREVAPVPSPRRARLIHVDAETGFSGGEVQVFPLLEGLRRRGWECILIAPPGSRALEEARRSRFEVRAVPMRSDLDLFSVSRLARAMRECEAGLVHLHTGRATWLGGLAARRAGLPAITTRRMDRGVKPGWRTRYIYERCTQRAVAISDAVARRLREGGVDPERIVVVKSSVDPGALVPARPRAVVRAEFGLRDDETALLVLASLVHRKGVDVLIEALAHLSPGVGEWRLLVAGDGPERSSLKERARTLLPGRVLFLGRRDDKADLLAACDVFCLPSRAEGLGVAALEAMAVGKPVVATRVGGLGEAVIEGRTGILAQPGDAASLTAKLDLVLRERSLRERLGDNGPARVAEGYLADQMVEAYERIYGEVLSEVAGGNR